MNANILCGEAENCAARDGKKEKEMLKLWGEASFNGSPYPGV